MAVVVQQVSSKTFNTSTKLLLLNCFVIDLPSQPSTISFSPCLFRTTNFCTVQISLLSIHAYYILHQCTKTGLCMARVFFLLVFFLTTGVMQRLQLPQDAYYFGTTINLKFVNCLYCTSFCAFILYRFTYLFLNCLLHDLQYNKFRVSEDEV